MFNTSFPGSDHQTMFGWISYTILFGSRGISHRDAPWGIQLGEAGEQTAVMCDGALGFECTSCCCFGKR